MTQSSLLDVPPELLTVIWNPTLNKLTFTFDRPMREDDVEGVNMFCRLDGNETDLDNDTWTSPTTLQFDTSIAEANPGTDIVTWLVPPTSLFSTFNINLPVFTNFPVFIEPTLLTAVFFLAIQQLVLTFDTPMLEVPIDGSDFLFCFQNQNRDLTFLSWFVPTKLRFSSVIVAPHVGADVISFIGEDMEIKSITEVPLPDFTDFPVT